MLLVKSDGDPKNIDDLRPIVIQSVTKKLIELCSLHIVEERLWKHIPLN